MKIRALVVDDDQTQLRLLTAFLKKLNFEGNTAVNGEEAVDKMRDGQYDICFMDLQMPIMNGLEASQIIKEEITKDVPIIAVTGMDNFQYDDNIKKCMDDFIEKPVSLERLEVIIAKHCDQ